MDFEKELKESLRRVEPPAGFAERVMARLEPGAQLQVVAPRRKPAPRWLPWAAAACLILSGGGVGMWKQQREQARAREAGEQLLLALRVTHNQLEHVRTKVRAGLDTRQE